MPWSRIASDRVRQLLEGRDLTFEEVFRPTWQEIAQEFNPQHAPAADIGTGVGVLAKTLASATEALECFEPETESYRQAQRVLGGLPSVRLQNSSGEAGLREEAYFFVSASMVLHVVKDLPAMFRAVAGSLSPGGTFWFSVPHPCFYHLYKSDHIALEDYGSDRTIPLPFQTTLQSYLDAPPIPYVHRSLSDYSRHLRASGLSIISLREPMPPLRSSFPIPWKYPRYLFVGTAILTHA